MSNKKIKLNKSIFLENLNSYYGYILLLFYSQWFPFQFYILNNYRVYNNAILKYTVLGLKTTLSFILIVFFVCFLISFISKKNSKKIFFGVIVLNFIFNSLELGHYLVFSRQITAEGLYVIFETNLNESLALVKNFSSPKLLIIPIYWLLGYFIIKMKSKLKIAAATIMALIICTSSVYIIKTDGTTSLLKAHIFKNITRSISRYYKEKRDLELFFKNFEENYKMIQVKNDKDEAVYVWVIGESLKRSHSQVYGYPRENQPNLSREKQEGDLTVFNDVISPHSFTRETLKKLITTTAHDSKQKFTEAINIIDIMKKAGFKTYWISNQEDFEFRGAGLSAVNRRSDYLAYTEKKSTDLKDIAPDGVILPYLDEVLKDSAKKKFIVVHLYGSHISYSDRYPNEFTKYDLNDKPEFFNESEKERAEAVNHYDNSVYYNDYVMGQIIERLEKNSPESYLLYLSDHGCTIGEKNSYKNTAENVEIPFMIWTNKKYKENNKEIVKKIEDSDKNSPYSSEDTIYTLLELSSVVTPIYNSEKSIINENFKEKPRMISSDGLLYSR